MSRDLFLFGTLLDDALRAIVAGGAPLSATPGRLPDHVVRRARDADFPLLAPAKGQSVEGLVIVPDDTQLARLHYYEAGFGYVPRAARVEVGGTVRDVILYRPGGEAAVSDDPWSLTDWIADRGDLTRLAARESMSYFGAIDGDALRGRVPTIFLRAASRLRAEAQPMPTTLRSALHRDRIDVEDDRRPYTGYFRVDETDLRHPQFGGGRSDTLTRAGFVMADAVTVLPYDPVRDRVMVVEQFRFGPFARGDLHPWSLEPIAGRIDPGETPERAARREAREEADLDLKQLHLVGSHYVSPGAVTEYLFCYVGRADLPDGAGGLGGLESEGEDIRAHILTFARLMELVETGEVDNGPLHLSTLWLERERGRGRFA